MKNGILTQELEIFCVFSVFNLRHIHEHISDDIWNEIQLKLDPGEIAPEVFHIDWEIIGCQKSIKNLLLTEQHHEGLLSRNVTEEN